MGPDDFNSKRTLQVSPPFLWSCRLPLVYKYINSEIWQLCLRIYKVLLITWWKKLGVGFTLSLAFMRLKVFLWSPFQRFKSLETADWSNSNLCRVWQWVNYQNYAKLNFEKTILAFWILVCHECIYTQAYASYLSACWLIFKMCPLKRKILHFNESDRA